MQALYMAFRRRDDDEMSLKYTGPVISQRAASSSSSRSARSRPRWCSLDRLISCACIGSQPPRHRHRRFCES